MKDTAIAGPCSERRTRRVKQPNPAVINRERKDTAIAGPSSERRTRRVKQTKPCSDTQRDKWRTQQWLDPVVREGHEEWSQSTDPVLCSAPHHQRRGCSRLASWSAACGPSFPPLFKHTQTLRSQQLGPTEWTLVKLSPLHSQHCFPSPLPPPPPPPFCLS